MNKETTSSTHLWSFLRLEVKRTGSLSSLMHNISAIAKLISGGGQRSNIWFTLFWRVVVSSSLSAVAVSVNGVGSRSSFEFAGFLIVVVGHVWAWWQGGATTVGAWVVVGILVKEILGELEEGLGNWCGWEWLCCCLKEYNAESDQDNGFHCWYIIPPVNQWS